MYKIYEDDNRYKSKQWKHFRLAILKRDMFTCLECKRKGIRTTANTVHHIEPYIDELFYVLDNLISVCSACHNKMHNREDNTLTENGNKWVIRRHRGLIKK